MIDRWIDRLPFINRELHPLERVLMQALEIHHKEDKHKMNHANYQRMKIMKFMEVSIQKL